MWITTYIYNVHKSKYVWNIFSKIFPYCQQAPNSGGCCPLTGLGVCTDEWPSGTLGSSSSSCRPLSSHLRILLSSHARLESPFSSLGWSSILHNQWSYGKRGRWGHLMELKPRGASPFPKRPQSSPLRCCSQIRPLSVPIWFVPQKSHSQAGLASQLSQVAMEDQHVGDSSFVINDWWYEYGFL